MVNKFDFTGPWGMPIIGSLPIFQEPPSPDHYLKIAKKYDDIFSVTMGTTLIVCISSAKLLKEVFNRPDSTGRPNTPLNNLLGGFGKFVHSLFTRLHGGVFLCGTI